MAQNAWWRYASEAGIMAAIGIYALDHNIQRLAEDHTNAELLAHELAQMDEIEVVAVNTNIVFIKAAVVIRNFALHYLNKVLFCLKLRTKLVYFVWQLI